MNAEHSEHHPVVIVGAGSVGLTLAGELRRAGIGVLVLERLAERPPWARSLFVQNRTMDVLQQRGLDWFADAPRWTSYNFGFLRLGRLREDSDFVPRYAPQHKFEALLEGRARDMGAEIRRGHEVTGLSQDGDGADVTVRTAGGEYRVRADWLVGCDGGRSTIRKLAGFDFPGTPSTVSGITAWVSLRDEPFPGGVYANIYERGIFSLARMEPGMYRATTIEFDTELPERDEEVGGEELVDRARHIADVDLHLDEVHWISRFGNATRLAAQYRKGRVLLAGDAAHIHFASASQGLNTGVQDAVNLGWKLAAEIHGWAPPGLLDSYHDERHPIGYQVGMYSQAQVSLYYPVKTVAPLRQLLGELFQLEDVSRHLLELSTGLSIQYPMTPSGEHPLLGRRVPDAPLVTEDGPESVFATLLSGNGVLLDLTGAGTGHTADDGPDRPDRVTLVRAEPVPELTAARLLIRPDGYVAHADEDGADDQGLRLALRTWFGEPRPGTAESTSGRDAVTASVTAGSSAG